MLHKTAFKIALFRQRYDTRVSFVLNATLEIHAATL